MRDGDKLPLPAGVVQDDVDNQKVRLYILGDTGDTGDTLTAAEMGPAVAFASSVVGADGLVGELP